MEDPYMNRNKIIRITLAGVVAALYTVLTVALPQLSYGPIQIRFAEALCMLPLIFPETIAGVTLGCLISNLLSPFGAADIIFGTLATLIATLIVSRMKNKWLAPIPIVLSNGIIVGGLIAWYETGFTQAFLPAFVYNCGTVALGEAVVCWTLGVLLVKVMPGIMNKARIK